MQHIHAPLALMPVTALHSSFPQVHAAHFAQGSSTVYRLKTLLLDRHTSKCFNKDITEYLDCLDKYQKKCINKYKNKLIDKHRKRKINKCWRKIIQSSSECALSLQNLGEAVGGAVEWRTHTLWGNMIGMGPRYVETVTKNERKSQAECD